MHSGKSRLSLATEALLRSVSASAIIFFVVALIAVLRGISQGVMYPLASDDWYLVAGFLTIWCLIPPILTLGLTFLLPKITRIVCYVALSITQTALLYAYSYYLSTLPDNELASSPLILLVYAALPIAFLFYPLFFAGTYWGKIRGGFALAAACIILYVFVMN